MIGGKEKGRARGLGSTLFIPASARRRTPAPEDWKTPALVLADRGEPAAAVPRSRSAPAYHLGRAALVDRHAHPLALRIAHLPPAVLLALDALPEARDQPMPHALRVRGVARQLAQEEALLQPEPDHHEGDRDHRGQRRDVRLQ